MIFYNRILVYSYPIMKKYVILEKKIGETPLSVLDTFKEENHWVEGERLAYAGRLDPMASGKLLVLIGKECKKQNDYLALDKEYTFDVLLGFSSDTGDVLGIAEIGAPSKSFTENSVRDILGAFTGSLSLPYPIFSSKTVRGKPLFLWTLENRLDEIEIPQKKSEVYRLSYRGSRTIHSDDLKRQIFEKINSIPKVTAPSKALGKDFRREEIRARWNELFNNAENDTFHILTFSCICSSGTYMRTLATLIGEELSTSGLAFRIHREKIGRYKKIFGRFGIWYKQFK